MIISCYNNLVPTLVAHYMFIVPKTRGFERNRARSEIVSKINVFMKNVLRKDFSTRI